MEVINAYSFNYNSLWLYREATSTRLLVRLPSGQSPAQPSGSVVFGETNMFAVRYLNPGQWSVLKDMTSLANGTAFAPDKRDRCYMYFGSGRHTTGNDDRNTFKGFLGDVLYW